MTITYELEPRDLRRFQRYMQKHLPSSRRANYILAGAVIASCLWMTVSVDDKRVDSRVIYFFVLLLTFGSIVSLAVFVALAITRWGSYRASKHRSVLCEHTISLTDDGIIEVTPFNEGRTLWKGIYQVAEDAEYIYIFITQELAHVIPKRAFDDAESARHFYEKALSLHKGRYAAEVTRT